LRGVVLLEWKGICSSKKNTYERRGERVCM